MLIVLARSGGSLSFHTWEKLGRCREAAMTCCESVGASPKCGEKQIHGVSIHSNSCLIRVVDTCQKSEAQGILLCLDKTEISRLVHFRKANEEILKK